MCKFSKNQIDHQDPENKSEVGLSKNRILQNVRLPEVIHKGLNCNGCNKMAPIRGNRYFCLICPNFNLCQNCGDTNNHQHELILTSSKNCYI